MKEESSLRPKKESTAGFFKTPARARDDIARRKRRRGKALRRIGTAVERGERERIVYRRRRAAVVYKGYAIYNEEEAEAEEEESSSGGALVPDSISNNSHPRERARGVLGSAPPPARKGGSERRTRGKNDKSLSPLAFFGAKRGKERGEPDAIHRRSLARSFCSVFRASKDARAALRVAAAVLERAARGERSRASGPDTDRLFSVSLLSLARTCSSRSRKSRV